MSDVCWLHRVDTDWARAARSSEPDGGCGIRSAVERGKRCRRAGPSLGQESGDKPRAGIDDFRECRSRVMKIDHIRLAIARQFEKIANGPPALGVGQRSHGVAAKKDGAEVTQIPDEMTGYDAFRIGESRGNLDTERQPIVQIRKVYACQNG